MAGHEVSRRTFVGGALGAVAAAGALHATARAQVQAQTQPGGLVRLGGPIFERLDDPEELARAHRALGYRAAYCPDVSLDDADRVRAFSEAFERNDVVIAEVGRWCNLLDADDEKRRANLDTVIQGLALADAIGARCCVDIAGSFNEKTWFGPHPDNLSERFFDAAVENARLILDAVKPSRSKFAYEMMGWALPDSVDTYSRMIQAVDRPGFAVHLDPCNLINCPERFYRNTELLNDCFDKLGPWIVSCHAKDLTWEIEMNVHFREVRPGAGSLDYETYLKRLAALPNPPPLMLEHLPNEEEYTAARTYLLELGNSKGVDFGQGG